MRQRMEVKKPSAEKVIKQRKHGFIEKTAADTCCEDAADLIGTERLSRLAWRCRLRIEYPHA